MALFDELKDKVGEFKDKAGDLAEGGAEKLRGAVDGVGDFVDEMTDGKYSSQVDHLQKSANGLLDKAGGNDTAPPA